MSRRYDRDSGVFRGVHVPDQSEILSMIAHDMRAPLVAIVGATELLEDPGTGSLNEDQKHLLSLLRRSGERLRCLAQELAELGAAGKGVLELAVRDEDLGNLIRMAVEETCLLPQAQGKDVVVDVTRASRAAVDPARMGRALINLMANALHHCRDTVWVSVEQKGTEQVVKVEDDGEGIAEHIMPHLFEPFVRGPKGHTGLGLAIVREIVRAHGGHVSAARSDEHGGACFALSLPLREQFDRAGGE